MILIATDGIGIVRAACGVDGRWSVERIATPGRTTSLARDPLVPEGAFAGTTDGVLRTRDGGRTWMSIALAGARRASGRRELNATQRIVCGHTTRRALHVSRWRRDLV